MNTFEEISEEPGNDYFPEDASIETIDSALREENIDEVADYV